MRSSQVPVAEAALGQRLAALCLRGHAIVAELIRLSSQVPPQLRIEEDPQFSAVAVDLRYLAYPEEHERALAADPRLQLLDEEFRAAVAPRAGPFFALMAAFVDFHQGTEEMARSLQSGLLLHGPVDVLLSSGGGGGAGGADGRALVALLALHAGLLLLLPHVLPGALRERLLVAHVRAQPGAVPLPRLESLCALARRTHARPPAGPGAPPPPVLRPEVGPTLELFARFPLPRALVAPAVAALRGGDRYGRLPHFPDPCPSHRSAALAQQGAALVMLLFHAPEVLRTEAEVMAEVCQRFLAGGWVLPLWPLPGFALDVRAAWGAGVGAAQAALAGLAAPHAQRDMQATHALQLASLRKELSELCRPGALRSAPASSSPSPSLSPSPSPGLRLSDPGQLERTLATLRSANVCVRWWMLHAHAPGSSETVGEAPLLETLLQVLLDTAEVEALVSAQLAELSATRAERWQRAQASAAARLSALAESGLAGDEDARSLREWFREIVGEVRGLSATATEPEGAQRVHRLLHALQEVEAFHQVGSAAGALDQLRHARGQLRELLYLQARREEGALETIAVVRDVSYLWQRLRSLVPPLRAAVSRQPSTLRALHALLAKLHPLPPGCAPEGRGGGGAGEEMRAPLRFYAEQLADVARQLMHAVPIGIFTALRQHLLAPPPSAAPRKESERARAVATIATLAQGTRAMGQLELLGIVKLDPLHLLQEGLRQELRGYLHSICNQALARESAAVGGGAADLLERLQHLAARVAAARVAMEEVGDLVGLAGAEVVRAEMARVVWAAARREGRQRTRAGGGAADAEECFMGPLLLSLLRLSDPAQSLYLRALCAWFGADGQELLGLRTWAALLECFGPAGLAALDHLLALLAARTLQQILAGLRATAEDPELAELQAALETQGAAPEKLLALLSPSARAPPAAAALSPLPLASLGRLHLLHTQLACRLRATALIEVPTLAASLEALSATLLQEPQDAAEGLEPAAWTALQRLWAPVGLHVHGESEAGRGGLRARSEQPQRVALRACALTVAQLPRFILDPHLGTLTSKSRKAVLDAGPMVVGLATLLRHCHAGEVTKYLEFMRTVLQAAVGVGLGPGVASPASSAMSVEVASGVIWLQAFREALGMTGETMAACVVANLPTASELKKKMPQAKA